LILVNTIKMKLKTFRKWIYRPGDGVVRLKNGAAVLKMELQTKKWNCRPGNGVVRLKMELQTWKWSCKAKKWSCRPGNGVVRLKNGAASLGMEL
jgi:hypothetical protein